MCNFGLTRFLTTSRLCWCDLRTRRYGELTPRAHRLLIKAEPRNVNRAFVGPINFLTRRLSEARSLVLRPPPLNTCCKSLAGNVILVMPEGSSECVPRGGATVTDACLESFLSISREIEIQLDRRGALNYAWNSYGVETLTERILLDVTNRYVYVLNSDEGTKRPCHNV
ncbi:hypothetical protein EVAR_19465_1 [Eumeta japonica]|uniref:Uncharacterized protein n=1 Tax=Eumeta variegata TaxID=151549 RepID=A0A4C1VCA8_EUMVA|nr:hypothetical protein EVAR_19465_1 [Eumeta japonica]